MQILVARNKYIYYTEGITTMDDGHIHGYIFVTLQ